MDACVGCFRQKISCWPGCVGRQKKAAKEKDAKEPEESGTYDGESVGNGRQWMKKFSRMKVGPPKGVKTVMG